MKQDEKQRWDFKPYIHFLSCSVKDKAKEMFRLSRKGNQIVKITTIVGIKARR